MSDAWSTRPLTLADDPVGPFCFRSNFLLRLTFGFSMLFVYFVVFFSACLSCFLSRDLVRARVGKHWCPSIYEAASGNGPNGQKEKNGG